jgi:hypothetical protein
MQMSAIDVVGNDKTTPWATLRRHARIESEMQGSQKHASNLSVLKAFPPHIIGLLIVQIAVVNGILVIGSIYLGKALDARMNTGVLFTVVLAVISLQLALFITYKLAMRAVAKVNRADARLKEIEPPIHT